jgi:hypothetical protein
MLTVKISSFLLLFYDFIKKTKNQKSILTLPRWRGCRQSTDAPGLRGGEDYRVVFNLVNIICMSHNCTNKIHHVFSNGGPVLTPKKFIIFSIPRVPKVFAVFTLSKSVGFHVCSHCRSPREVGSLVK